MSAAYPDQVRWFDALGACSACRKPANGKLMGSRNESYGAYCVKCAERRLKKAEKERARTDSATNGERG